VPFADVVTFTTYKTLLGPHGGMILSRGTLAGKIDRGVFPGTQGTPSFGMMAAKAVCLGYAATPAFRSRMQLVLDDARTLADALAGRGYRLVAGGTDTHQVLVDLRSIGLTGDVADTALEAAGILTNRNVIPFDPGTPRAPSGLRLGLTAAAQRGIGPAEMAGVASMIDRLLRAPADDYVRSVVTAEVAALLAEHPIEAAG
jgi:glycine hydroxymethyltransferase